MSNTLLSSVRRVPMVRPLRAPWSAALFSLALIAGVTMMKPAAFAQQVVGEFEMDGDKADPTPSTAPFDWDSATPANGFGNAPFTDPPSGSDTTFASGSKEDAPNNWSFESPPLSGNVPGKGDFLGGAVAFHVVNTNSGPQQFLYVNFTLAAGQGSVHVDYEFNQLAETFTNSKLFVVPKRKQGDIVISFDQGGGNTLVPAVLQWNGNELTGSFTDITPTFGPSDFGSFLSTDTTFGEAALNISLIDNFGLCGASTFKKFWAKSRSSEGITTVLKDRTPQFDVHVCDDGNACTTDQCDITATTTNFCTFTPISCDDGFSCTTDTCDGNGGCVHTPVNSVCDDSNVCTNDACNPSAPGHDPATGCAFTPGNGGTVCRASAGVCDLAETCTGSSADCPADVHSTAQCRASAGVCDVAESCDGIANDCPADVKSTAVCRASAGVCDVAESCNGTTNDCPADGFVSSSTVCRASGGVCDVPENCTGSSATCPADAKSTAVCRASAGICDVAESCNGTTNDCPADGFVSSSTVCRASGGVCDVPENCTGSSATCPADAKSTAVCRASAGICDVAESCNGTSNDCPADGFVSSSTVCRPSAGVCDLTENCTGTGSQCPADAKSTALCRASAGECDIAENCNGSSNDCPADAKQPSGTSCSSDGRNCTTDQCDGTSVSCQHDDNPVCAPPTLVKSVRNDTKDPTGEFTTDTNGDPGNTVEFQLVFTAGQDANDINTVITDDVPDRCTYVANSCSDGNPANDGDNNTPDDCTVTTTGNPAVTTITFDPVSVPAGTSVTFTFQCTLDATFPVGTTDVTNIAVSSFDQNGQTPPNSNPSTVHVGAECTTSADCDDSKPCTENNCVTGHCQFPAGNGGTLCRASAGACDTEERCTGTDTECPVDAKSTAVCRASAGECDVAESCDGTTNDCPADVFVSSSTECRGSAGACDLAENCTGSSATCPDDVKSTAVCRASAGICDVAESCNGTSNDCPTDGFVSSSTVCRPSAGVCDLTENCTGTGSQCPADAKSTALCRASAGECDIAENCNGSSNDCPADAKQPSGTSCSSDGRNCTTDQCDGTSVSCQHDDNPVCAPPTLVKSVRNDTKDPTGEFTTDTNGDPGNTVEFQLVFTAGQDANDINTVITDDVPDRCTYVANSCSDGNPANDGDNNTPDDCTVTTTGNPAVTTITFDPVSVPAGTSVTFTFQCTLDATFPVGTTDVTNIAVSSFDQNGQTPPNSNPSTVHVGAECTTSADCDDSKPCTENNCVTGHCQFPAGNGGTLCRASAGACDTEERCTGTDTECPVDAKSTAVCRASAGECDVAESCDGTTNDCPADVFVSSSTECRGSAGACDLAENCTGSSATCPADVKSTAVCRASAGACDVAESCSGGDDCPADGFAPSSLVCRASAGVCDVAENCTGSSAFCPDDAKSTAVCRTSAGICDVAESCSGGNDCPADEFAPSSQVCRASAGVCDQAESCTGSGAECPADINQPDGNPCNDDVFCNGTDTCVAGSCVHSGDPCGDPFECTIDKCSEENIPHCTNTPEDTICNDNNECTADRCVGAGGDPVTGCQNIAQGVGETSARAFGISVDLGGKPAIVPTPDSDKKNPDDLLAVPLPPVADVRVLHVEESESSDTNGADASAEASTAKVRLIQQQAGSLVSVDAIQATVKCHADETTAGCSSLGSTLTNVRVNGNKIGDVNEPVDLMIDLPGLLVAHVQLLEMIGRGANAGVPQPNDKTFSSGLTINAVHVTVTLLGKPVSEIIIGHAQADVSFGNGNTCEPIPLVSGRAYVIGRERPLEERNIITQSQVGEVNLPATGGSQDATLADLGPVGDGSNNLVLSRTASSHTEGTTNKAANTASSKSYAFIEDLGVLDTGGAPTNPLIGATLVRSDCEASAAPGGASSSGTTTLVGLSIGGQDICKSLGLESTCKPPPNTVITVPILAGTTITLNEQIPDPPGSGSTGITVNAIHIVSIDPLNPFGLPNVGAELAISHSHCDASSVVPSN